MEQETDYLDLLQAVVAYRIDGQRLNLLDSSQRAILVFGVRSDASPTSFPQSTNSGGPLQASLSVDSLENLEYRTRFTQTGRAPLIDFQLALVTDLNGGPINRATAFLGDRVAINSVNFEDGDLLVDFVRQGPDDPMCCPA